MPYMLFLQAVIVVIVVVIMFLERNRFWHWFASVVALVISIFMWLLYFTFLYFIRGWM